MRGHSSRTRPAILLLALLIPGCEAVDQVRERLRGSTPHEDYAQALDHAGLLGTALGQDWLAAAQLALREPLSATAPAEETGYFDAADPHAIGLRVRLQRGQRVVVRAALQPDTTALLFLDVFHVLENDTVPRHVAAADSGARALEFEPPRTADYIVRLQPELLRGGRYTIAVISGPALAFPVDGVLERAIGSRFGAARDGGAREHHGIDIFAPRGTAVLAAAPGIVNRVNETARGGRVVWLRDERRGLSLYYAHLDSQYVSSGARVAAGDTLGTVGNTGNARTTPPHLHFGIYRRGEGPVDPFGYVHRPSVTPARLTADTALFGEWARSAAAVEFRGVRIPAGTALLVRGAAADSYRVELPDGTAGWVGASAVESTRRGLATTRAVGCPLRDRPAPGAAIVSELNGASLAVLARYDQFSLVRTDSLTGWTDCV